MSEQLRERIQTLMPQARQDLAALVAMKSVADPRQFPPQECERTAQWVLDAFAEVGFVDLELVETADGSKAVSGHRPGPDGAPTVLLYAHYDVQPPLGDDAWQSPPFELTERDGRWYGRGTADCKGNIVMHLTALRALGADVPVTLKLIVEGSEEQGTGGLEEFVPGHADLLRADAILVCDTGNAAVGVPAVTSSLRGIANVVVTVDALSSEMHSGMYGGAAPDALAALIHMLATLRDADGDTTVDGLEGAGVWDGEPYPPQRFRADANVLDGVDLLGSGTVSDMVWARPALTVLGIDCPPVVGSVAAIQPRARARLNLRVPPGIDPLAAQGALIAHLKAHAPWNVKVTVEPESDGSPFRAVTDGPAYTALGEAMLQAYGREMAQLGQGGSIPLCNVFAQTFPAAEIILMGVEEPLTLIHAPNESVDPSEIANMALSEALFLQLYARQRAAADVAPADARRPASPAEKSASRKSASRKATAAAGATGNVKAMAGSKSARSNAAGSAKASMAGNAPRATGSPAGNVKSMSGPPAGAKKSVTSKAAGATAGAARKSATGPTSSARKSVAAPAGGVRKVVASAAGPARKSVTSPAKKAAAGPAKKTVTTAARKSATGSARQAAASPARKSASAGSAKRTTASAATTAAAGVAKKATGPVKKATSPAKSAAAGAAKKTATGPARKPAAGSAKKAAASPGKKSAAGSAATATGAAKEKAAGPAKRTVAGRSASAKTAGQVAGGAKRKSGA